VTRLGDFIRENGILPAQLARVACVSRQHLLRLRTGTADPTRHVMARLTMGCNLLLNRRVLTSELFDLMDTGL
jgi:predicted transcriptional regulator